MTTNPPDASGPPNQGYAKVQLTFAADIEAITAAVLQPPRDDVVLVTRRVAKIIADVPVPLATIPFIAVDNIW